MTLNEYFSSNRRLFEDAGGAVSGGPASASIGSDTTNSSNVQYVPSNFGATITPKLKQLSKKKTKYGVKVLQTPTVRKYKIEECLTIEVKNNMIPLFKRDFFNGKDIWESEFDIDLTAYLNEAFSDEMILAGEDFKQVVTKLVASPVFQSFRHKIAGFVNDSGDIHLNFAPIGNSLLTEPLASRQIQEFIALVEKRYKNDLGGLQMLTRAIAERQPLNSFPLFAKIDNFIGTQLAGEFLGIPFIYDSEITADYIGKEKLKIGNTDLENRLKTNPDMKWENGIFYPNSENGFASNLSELLVKYIKGDSHDSTSGK